MPLLESIEMCINDATIKHCSEYANFWKKYDIKLVFFLAIGYMPSLLVKHYYELWLYDKFLLSKVSSSVTFVSRYVFLFWRQYGFFFFFYIFLKYHNNFFYVTIIEHIYSIKTLLEPVG